MAVWKFMGKSVCVQLLYTTNAKKVQILVIVTLYYSLHTKFGCHSNENKGNYIIVTSP